MTDMGTHVPLVAYWKGHTPPGKVLDDLVDFTDFYPTLADVAGIELGKDDPIDGRSFFPQLRDESGNPRDWVLCHYQPYWKEQPGQFARTAEYKLYRDGRFFEPSIDLEEKYDLAGESKGEQYSETHLMLQRLLESAPRAPTKVRGRNAKQRPLYPDWKKL